MKSLILWGCILIIPFIGFVASFYFGKDFILKNTNKDYAMEYAANQIANTAESDSVDSVANVIAELLKLQDEYVTKINEQTTLINKQKKEIEQLAAMYEKLKTQTVQAISEKKKKRIQDLAKTLGAMKQEVITPILTNLPDDIIKLLYDSAKSKDRAKIFNSMSPARAGRLMRKLAENAPKDK